MSEIARLNQPTPIQVRVDAAQLPARILTARTRRWVRVEQIIDAWQIDDRWWTDNPVRRCYFSCQTAAGALLTIFYDVDAGAWYAQRA